MFRHLTKPAALAATCAVALAGCGEETLDRADAEKQIGEGIEQQQKVKPEKVECPDDMKPKKDETYECTVTYPDGKESEARLTMLDDEGKFRFVVPPRQ